MIPDPSDEVFGLGQWSVSERRCSYRHSGLGTGSDRCTSALLNE